MTARLILVSALLLPAAARAGCSSMNAATFDEYVADAGAAIDDDDLVKHGAVFRAFQDQLPCMDEQIPAESWANFLVGYAVVEFAMGREWNFALDVALGIKPTVSRDYGPVEVRNYVPTARYEDAEAPLLPDDAEVYLDGKRIKHEPEGLGNLHIVQQFKNGVWNTRLLMNEPFPEDWKVQFTEEEEDSVARSPLLASVYLLGGFASGGQAVTQGSAGGAIGDIGGGGALVGLGSYGDFAPGSVGLFWDIYGPFRIDEGLPGIEAYAGPSIAVGDILSLQPGLGVGSVTISDAVGARPAVLLQGHVGAQLTTPMSANTSMELGAGGGAGPSGWHGRGRWGVTGGSGLGWNAGLEVSAFTGYFVEGGSERKVAASAYRLGLRGGLAFR